MKTQAEHVVLGIKQYRLPLAVVGGLGRFDDAATQRGGFCTQDIDLNATTQHEGGMGFDGAGLMQRWCPVSHA